LSVSPTYATLANGLRVAVAPQPAMHRAFVGVWLRVGSRFETPADNGLSHFVEHMVHRGTTALPSAHALAVAFERLGCSLSAITDIDHGIYSFALPSESLDRACGVLGDVLGRPAFGDIEIEREIVIDELLDEVDDEGRQVDPDNLARTLIYGEHPLAQPIGGTAERVRSFDESALRRWHSRHYTGANAIVVVSGAVDVREAMRIVERSFGSLPAGTRVAATPATRTQRQPRLAVHRHDDSQSALRLCMRAFSEERPALDVVMRVVDSGQSSRLYHRLSNAGGLCYDASAEADGYEDDGVVVVAATVQHDRVVRVTREILSIFRELADEGPTDEEMEAARRQIEWDARARADSIEETAAFYASGLMFNRTTSEEERVARLVAVTADEVRDVARELVAPERLNVVAVGLLDARERKRLRDVVMDRA
jgi:predicted Zn-dependent peptidase